MIQTMVFSRHLDLFDGEAISSIRRRLDASWRIILADFEKWKSDNGIVVIALDRKEQIPRWIEHDCFARLIVTYDGAQASTERFYRRKKVERHRSRWLLTGRSAESLVLPMGKWPRS